VATSRVWKKEGGEKLVFNGLKGSEKVGREKRIVGAGRMQKTKMGRRG